MKYVTITAGTIRTTIEKHEGIEKDVLEAIADKKLFTQSQLFRKINASSNNSYTSLDFKRIFAALMEEEIIRPLGGVYFQANL